MSLCDFKAGIRSVLCECVDGLFLSQFVGNYDLLWLVVLTSRAIIAIISQKSSEIKYLYYICCVFSLNIE